MSQVGASVVQLCALVRQVIVVVTWSLAHLLMSFRGATPLLCSRVVLAGEGVFVICVSFSASFSEPLDQIRVGKGSNLAL